MILLAKYEDGITTTNPAAQAIFDEVLRPVLEKELRERSRAGLPTLGETEQGQVIEPIQKAA